MVTEREQQYLFVPLAMLLVFSLLYVSQARNSLYNDPVSLWEDTARKSPHRERPHYNLGTELKNIGKIDQAQYEWEKTLELNPRHSQALNQMGTLWFLRKDHEKAENYYRSSVQADMNNIEANYNLAMTLERKGEITQSMQHYEIFLRLATPEYKDQIIAVSRKINMLRAAHPN